MAVHLAARSGQQGGATMRTGSNLGTPPPLAPCQMAHATASEPPHGGHG